MDSNWHHKKRHLESAGSKRGKKKKPEETPFEYLTAVHARLVKKLSAEFQRCMQQCIHNTKVVPSSLTSKLACTVN